jgi:predicted enzyme related to lactoylglutathione lyase
MKILFVAGFGPITQDPQPSVAFYRHILGITFEQDGDYAHTEALAGVKSFAVWPLSQAAESCFGTPTWPDDLVVPQAWLEFDVDDVEAASKELTEKGYKPLVSCRKEPWGQIVSRLLTPEGLLLGLTYTPWMRKET